MSYFKGKRVRSVGISEKHALVLVNYGAGMAKELTALETAVRTAVEDKFGVKLVLEVEKIGVDPVRSPWQKNFSKIFLR